MRRFIPTLVLLASLVCLPAFCQEFQTLRIGVVPLSGRNQKESSSAVRDRLVAALNGYQFDKKLNLAVQAIALDAAAVRAAIAEGRSKKCEFVLFLRVGALEKSNTAAKDSKATLVHSEVDTALLEYELRRVTDGAAYVIGIVKSEKSESAEDALQDAVSRIPNKLAADLRNESSNIVEEARSKQLPQDANSELAENENSCAWLPKDIPHAQALRGVCEYAVIKPVKMPNFICEQETSRFVGRNRVPSDLITSTIRYVDGEESFSNLKRNGRPAPAAMWDMAGLWSSGQFEGNLRAIFYAGNRAKFTFSGANKIGTHIAFVFTYQIERQYEPLWELRADDQLAAPPYEGELWVEEKTGEVLRLRSTASELPAGFPIRKAEIVTDYENVTFPDGAGSVLPVKSTIETHYKDQAPTRNVIEFRGCRKFRAMTRMLTDVPGSAAGGQIAVATTAEELMAEREENETIYTILREEAISEDAVRMDSEQRQELKSVTGEAFWKLAQLDKLREQIAARENAKAMRPPSDYEMVTTRNGVTTFNTYVRLVPISVVVRDSKGHAVGDLKQENFQILDNRKLQEIINFSMEKSPGEESNSEPAATVTAGGSGHKTIIPSYFAYLFDDLHASNEDLGKARAAAEKHLKLLPLGEHVAIYTVSDDVSLDFTTDRDKLQAALKKLKSHSIASSMDCPQMDYYTADLLVNQADPSALQLEIDRAMACHSNGAGISTEKLPTLPGGGGGKGAPAITASPQGFVVQGARQLVMARAVEMVARGKMESDRTLAVLNDVMNRTARMPGHRSVVLLSPGFLALTRGQQRASMYLIEYALKTGVVFNALDVHGLSALELDANRTGNDPSKANQLSSDTLFANGGVMADLAYGTGGVYFHNHNDLNEGLNRTAEIPQYVYVLGFSPQALDNKFHKLKIQVKGSPNLTIEARTGYYALRPPANQQTTGTKNRDASASGPLVMF
jgi:VWFA-related protein